MLYSNKRVTLKTRVQISSSFLVVETLINAPLILVSHLFFPFVVCYNVSFLNAIVFYFLIEQIKNNFNKGMCGQFSPITYFLSPPSNNNFLCVNLIIIHYGLLCACNQLFITLITVLDIHQQCSKLKIFNLKFIYLIII